ncbi:MAG: ogr/Delta-like zinc finger family protein [bacterium]
MTEHQDRPACPHCGARLLKWLPPPNTSWGGSIQYACFNDDCPYYMRGWEHMMNKYQMKASYRFRLDPVTGETGPLAVWSKTAARNCIVPTENEEE